MQQRLSNKSRLLLHDECCKGDVNVACLLLEKYPDIVNSTTTGCFYVRWTTLHVAAQSDRVDCIKLLLQHGADIEATTIDGSTPLHIVAFYGWLPAVKCLLEKGAQGTAINNKCQLPLHGACSEGRVKVARLLLEKYADIVNLTTTGWFCARWTPLHFAAERGRVDCIELLLQHGVDIEATTVDGSTPLRIATDKKHLLAVKYLLGEGARELAPDNKRQLPSTCRLS